MTELEVTGIPNEDIIYPLLVSVYGKTKVGKTYFGASFPNAIIIDFPPMKMRFGGIDIDQAALMRTVGEGFRSLFTPTKKSDGSVAWVPKIPNFDFRKQYNFPKTWEEFQTCLKNAKSIADINPNEKIWIVIDDTYRWRAMEVQHYITVNHKKWPSQVEFGLITQSMSAQLTTIQNFANVLLIHRMTKDFDTQLDIPLIYPSGSDFNSDLLIELVQEVRSDKKIHQVAKIHSTGYDCPTNPTYQNEVIDPSPEMVLAAAKIPSILW